MDPINEQIRRLTPEIWDAVLHLPLESQDSMPPAPGRTVSACIHIAGAWNGAVALSCDVELAQQAAVIMFDLGATPPTTFDVQDALGELTNMVGGNIKALLPEPCHLSLPAAVEGADYSVRILRSRELARIPFRCGSYSMSLSLLQREEKAA